MAYYSIQDLEIQGRCRCYGHADACALSHDGLMKCACQHNTCGVNCQRCCHGSVKGRKKSKRAPCISKEYLICIASYLALSWHSLPCPACHTLPFLLCPALPFPPFLSIYDCTCYIQLYLLLMSSLQKWTTWIPRYHWCKATKEYFTSVRAIV